MDLHPFVVHFPVALLTVAALFDLVALFTGREALRRTAFLLLAAGTVGALAAALTGDAAEHDASRLPGIHEALERHEDLATAVIWSAVLITLLRAHFVLKQRFLGAVCVVFALLSLTVAGLVLWTGYTGGRMVYEFGAGTRPAMETVRGQDTESE